MGSVLEFPVGSPTDIAVGARIRRWRGKRGMEQAELARLLHMSPAEIRMIEAGRRHLGMAEIDATTRALRLPIWALVTDSAST